MCAERAGAGAGRAGAGAGAGRAGAGAEGAGAGAEVYVVVMGNSDGQGLSVHACVAVRGVVEVWKLQ